MKKKIEDVPIEVITHGNKIISIIEDNLAITKNDIMSKSRKQTIISARSILFAVMTYNCNFQVVDTASFVNMDHASVLHNLNTHRDLMETNFRDYKSKFLRVQEDYMRFDEWKPNDEDETMMIKIDMLANEILKIQQMFRNKLNQKRRQYGK